MANEHLLIFALLLVPLIPFIAAQNVFVVAPNMFRLGASETVAVFFTKEMQEIDLYLQDYPGMKNTFSRLKVLRNDTQVVHMRVDPENIPDLALSPLSTSNYVVLVAEGKNFRQETKVPVSLHSGYLFIQTDKPIYTPGQTVHIRIIHLNEEMLVEKGNFTLEVRSPQNMIIGQSIISNEESGLYSNSFRLPSTAKEGEWSVVVKYGHKSRLNETVVFEVKKYSLPTYEVTINAPKVVFPKTENVVVEIKARYFYRKDVDGTAKCKFSVLSREMKNFLIASVEGTMLREGKAICNISSKHFKDIDEVRWFPNLNNWRLIVEAEVTERATGQKENATSTNTVFSQTEYQVDFKRTQRDFIPGHSVTVLAVITEHSGKVAPDVICYIEARDQDGKLITDRLFESSDEKGKVSFLIPTTAAVKRLHIRVVTEDVLFDEHLQAQTAHVMFPLNSINYVFLDRSTIPRELKIGKEFTSTVYASPDDIAIFYVVTTGGRVVHLGSLATNARQRILRFHISDLMVPSVRITLFAVHNGITLTDSIKIDVEKECRDQAKISVVFAFNLVSPGTLDVLRLHGKSGTVVGVLAVDKPIYALRNKGLLTKEKMYSKMEEHDLGCGPGGGIDPELVLANAGLIILSDTSTISPERTYSELQFVPDNGKRLYEYITQEREEVPETWLFDTYVIGEKNYTSLHLTVPHGITTWMIQAVGVNPNHGMCVADPVEERTYWYFVVQLQFPYSVVRKEQIEIRATVFNYGAKPEAVSVYMYGVEGLCSNALPNSRGDEKKIYVPGRGGAETVTFPLVPLEIGEFSIKVVAVSTLGSYTVVKKLNVMAEGITHVENIVIDIDPSNVRKWNKIHFATPKYETHIDPENKQQHSTVFLTPEQDFIKRTDSCKITAIGKNFGPVVQITLNNLDQLIEFPFGSEEETIFTIAPSLYTLHYLKATGKLFSREGTKAYKYLRGFAKELFFRNPDGSYNNAWLNRPSSTWLTAFAVKVVCQAKNYVFIDESTICTALNWLAELQTQDGSFIYHVPGAICTVGFDRDISMTAFVTITLFKCRCGKVNLDNIKEKAVRYLTEIHPTIRNPYQLSIVAYALSLADPTKVGLETNKRLLDLSKVNKEMNTRHWGHPGTVTSVETASYALLTQLVYGNLDIAGSIVNWMNTQPITQETVIALEALAEYTIFTRNPDKNLACNLTSSDDFKFKGIFEFNTTSSRVLRSYELNKLKGQLYLDAVGTGVGTLHVQLRYNVPKKLDDICKFEIKVNVTEAKEIFKPQTISAAEPKISSSMYVANISICVKYLSNQNTNMTIVDTGIFTGFTPNKIDLDMIVSDTSIPVKRYEESGRNIVFYFDYIPYAEPVCFSFRATRKYIVGNLESSTIKAFDYYKPEHSCTVFYSPDHDDSPLIQTVCTDQVCKCADGGCAAEAPFKEFLNLENGEWPEQQRKQQLLELVCDESDYAWRVLVEKIDKDSSSFSTVNVKVLSVLKEGRESRSGFLREPERQFLLRKTCKTGHLEVGKTYIIMGVDQEPMMRKDQELKYRYYIDRQTRIYEWFHLDRERRVNNVLEWLLQQSFNALEDVLTKEGCLY